MQENEKIIKETITVFYNDGTWNHIDYCTKLFSDAWDYISF
jgi:hypothetical protein